MSLVSLLILLIVVGVALYIIQLLPMNATIKQIIIVLAVLIVVIYILQSLLGSGPVLRLK